MSATRRRLMLHGLAILVLVAAAAYMHYAINAIADAFIEIREADARFFGNLVKDNWNGISTLSSEKKEALVRNLDPVMAGADIRSMRDIMLVLMYAFVAGFVLQTVGSAIKIYKAGNSGHAL